MRNLLENFHTIVFDFDGVLTDNFVYIDENSIESVRVSRADGYALDQKKNDMNLDIFILSTEKNKVVQARAAKLQLACISGESNKLQSLRDKFVIERPSDPTPFLGLIYFGNDLNDLPVILEAGMSLVPDDAHPKVKEASTHILNNTGGHGFVREGVEFLIGIDAMSPEELSEFISDS